MKALSREGCSAFLEIGPNPVLLGMGRQCLADNQGWWLPSLRQGQPDWRQMLLALARLYVEGSSVTWKQFDQHCAPQRITQPTYPFQRKVFWVEEPETEQTPASSRNGSGTGPRAHPLLGYQIRLAGARELRFESRIGPSHPAFLDHHRIFSKAVVPLTAYLEMALAAGKVALGTQHLVLKDVVIHKALILSEAGEVILQTVLTPDVAGGYGFEIYSLDSAEPASDPGWTKHVMGCVSSGHASESPATADLAELQVEVAAAVEVEEYYRQFAERALRYGPDFQAIRRLHHAPGRSLAEISLSQKLLPEADGYLLHPVLMDACQQAAAAVLPSTAAGDTYLPVGIARLELFRATGNHFWSHARLSSGDRRAEKLLPETTIEMFDASGVGIARLEGLSVRRASADALMAGSASDFESWLYQVVWRVQPRRPRSINASPDAQPGTWLIFTDSKGLGSELAARLREVHHRVVLVEAGKTFEQVSRDCYRVDPEDAAHFHELFGKRLGASGDLRGVVHLWSLLDDDLGNPRPDLETVQRVQTLGCRSALNAVHSIDEFGGAPPALWLVTRAARAVGGKAPLNVAQAPLWGLGRAISVERPELQCRCLDLDPARPADEAGELAEEVLNASPEDQIAWRSGERKVARLARWEEGAATRRAISDAEAFRLAISDSGILEEVRLRPTSRRHPGTGQVEIEVRASGLNFRDVLQALGVLRGKAAQTTVGAAAEMLMGSECAGTVVEVGDGVSDSKVGDEVVALAQGSMASRVTVARELTFPKPERLSFEEAAALPVVFLTAYFGLHHLAKIRPGDRVLVHAAAGGVGQAAIQLAHNAGAEVLATASPAKWDFLRAVGVQHVMNSRSLDFSDQVLAITDGKGVDIVLNSLSGEFIRKSFDALRRGGRFLEIGKIGIWEQERVSQVRPDVSYYAYDIAAEMTKDPQAIRSMMSEIISGFREGRLNPPPLRVFPVTEAAGAFRLMAEGKHIGKIVLSVHGGAAVASIPAHAPIRSDASYLITGGLGMLGLKVAGWMARRGAGRLVLCGRSQPSAAAHQAIEEIISEGTQVKVVVADVTSPRSVESLVSAADLGDLPLRGIVHAAGVLHDGVLSEQSWENMREVMGPKIDGAWNLHLASQNCPLGFFVCFSSTASTLGSAAQANYAAGNAFLDALAHHRKALGLPGLTINWGPWGEVGMAARLGEQAATRRAVRGIADIPPDTGLRILEYSLALPGAVQIGVSPINWQKFLDPGARVIPFFEILAGIGGPARESNLLKQLKESLPAKRRSLLVAYVRAQLAKAVGLESGDTITPEQRFLDLGIDSLIAIELRNRLQEDLGSPLAQTVIFDYPTLGGLVSYLETLVVGGEPVEPESKRKPADSVRAVDRSELDDFLKDIGDLTETEIKNRLTQRRQPLSARR